MEIKRIDSDYSVSPQVRPQELMQIKVNRTGFSGGRFFRNYAAIS